ncbi:MAG: QcrA and Rieske domain-containing protein [Solirubrobacteraceae bacterium]
MSEQHDRNQSRYTADRLIPGAFEGETITRRRFMTGTAHTAGAVAAAAFTLPTLAFAIGPVFKEVEHHWSPAGPTNLFSNDNYVPVVVTVEPGVGEIGKTTVYIRQKNPKIDTDKYDNTSATPYIAITNRCAHLGCSVRWVEAAERFICPCHGGVYDFLGVRVAGPPVRPLDRFFTRVNKEGIVEVGPRFSLNSELRRFSPRDPGETLDGIGQYLYPSRPSVRI